MAFERALLASLGSLRRHGVHEGMLEASLHALGVEMYLSAEAGVSVCRRDRPVHAVRMAFALARGYMGRRLEGQAVFRRLGRALTCPVVPFLLFSRVMREVGRSSHLRRPFRRAACWLFLLQLAWGLGEGVGALAGVGRSDEQWR